MLYQPMTDSQAEDAYIETFMMFICTRDPAVEAALFAYMQHLKRDYRVIPAAHV